MGARAAGVGSGGGGAITPGDNSAGNGGDGYFFGAMMHARVAIYEPINIAVAGYNSTADAHQTNITYFGQTATQIAGVGGDGGDGNAAIGGDVAVSRTGYESLHTVGWGGFPRDHGSVGFHVVAGRADHSGNG